MRKSTQGLCKEHYLQYFNYSNSALRLSLFEFRVRRCKACEVARKQAVSDHLKSLIDDDEFIEKLAKSTGELADIMEHFFEDIRKLLELGVKSETIVKTVHGIASDIAFENATSCYDCEKELDENKKRVDRGGKPRWVCASCGERV